MHAMLHAPCSLLHISTALHSVFNAAVTRLTSTYMQRGYCRFAIIPAVSTAAAALDRELLDHNNNTAYT